MDHAALEHLEKLRSGDPADISAADLNWLVDWANRSRKLDARYSQGDHKAFQHPWKVRTSRCDEIDRGWRVDVCAGIINDIVPSILYRRRDDPRGWKCPEDYVESPAKGERGWSADWVERDPLDDLDDPPWLLIVAPEPGATADPAWTLVPKERWPLFFSSQDELADAQIFRAYVMVSQNTRQNVIASGTWLRGMKPPPMNKFRVGTLPARPMLSFTLAGVWLDLATLWLVRSEPDHPDSDALYVQQNEFWPSWSAQIKPSALDLYPEIIQGELDLIYDAAATVVNWTV